MRARRIVRELEMLKNEYEFAYDDHSRLIVTLTGPKESLHYKNHFYRVEIEFPDDYPFSPPHIKFITPIYHPNIDADGRLCLDSLKMPPQGSFGPHLNIYMFIRQLEVLLVEPNTSDPLMPEIARLFINHPAQFTKLANSHTFP